MRVAYCIAAYKRPAQVERLVRRILTDDSRCIVLLHYDTREAPYKFTDFGSRVLPLPERPLYWGGPELVRLHFEMLDRTLDAECDYAVLLSGQDYPLRHIGGLGDTLASFDVWSSARPLDQSSRRLENLRRYTYQWSRVSTRANRPLRAIDRIARTVHLVQRSRADGSRPLLVSARMPERQLWWGIRSGGISMPIYVGSTWMSLSAKAIRAVQKSPHYVTAYLLRTPIPDEACLQTILHNSPSLTFAPDNGRFIHFTAHHPSPDILTTADLPKMLRSGAHFARKFATEVDADVLDALDQAR